MKTTAKSGPVRKTSTWVAAWICSGLVLIMLLAQLYAYEDFASALMIVVSFNDQSFVKLLAALLVVGELLALPYLLGMYLSTLMRLLSAVAGIMVAGFWLIIALTNAHAINVGFFSSVLELPGGIVAAAWTLLLTVSLVVVIAADSKFNHQKSISK